MRKFTFIALLCMLHISGYAQESSASAPYSDIISKYRHLSFQQLLDTANWYYNRNSNDTALICYSLIINTPTKNNSQEAEKHVLEALKKSAVICGFACDYRSACELLMQALLLCEKHGFTSEEPRIYNNIGNIYYRFASHDAAARYYSKALNLCSDSADRVVILNNLAAAELENGKTDTARLLISQSLQISRQHNNINLHTILNTIALAFQKEEVYDSAFYYYRLSLIEARKNNSPEREAEGMQGLAKLFFEAGQIDSARLYVSRSNSIAADNNFWGILSENHLTVSKIEEQQENHQKSLHSFKKYATLKDSILNVERFGDINQLQRRYEVSKINRQIEQLAVEQKIKDRTIRYRTIILLITAGVLLLVSGVLLLVFFQKRKLNRAYRELFEKNITIMELREGVPEKNQKSAMSADRQNDLLNRIMAVMENTEIICDADFSLLQLADMLDSNHTYVSNVINTDLNKNFRSFLNSYRIKEALRIFSEPDIEKYTIETVALRSGFKSRSAFYDAFKEITGVTPKFYLNEIQPKQLHL